MIDTPLEPEQVGSLSESLEDYLEIIFRLQLTNRVARIRDIANAKDVKTSSVISALQRLAKSGYVEYQAREFVDLTESGKELAFQIHQRHLFLKRFLTDLLQVDEETAEKDACSIEHAISLTTLEHIASFTEYLTYCPKVEDDLVTEFRDCWLSGTRELAAASEESPCGIWSQKDLLADKLGIRPLSAMKNGATGYISRLIGPTEIRRDLIQKGLLPSALIRLESSHEDAGYILLCEGEEILLSAEEADMVYVWVARETKTLPILIKSGMTLADLSPGAEFEVQKLLNKGEIRQRLLDMGFVKGAKGKILREALLHDPIEVEINGYRLSLRRSEAADIQLSSVNAPATA